MVAIEPWIQRFVAGAAALCLAVAAQAQAIDKAGAHLRRICAEISADIAARLLSERMAAELKQTVTVENKPGAAGHRIAEMLKNAPPTARR